MLIVRKPFDYKKISLLLFINIKTSYDNIAIANIIGFTCTLTTTSLHEIYILDRANIRHALLFFASWRKKEMYIGIIFDYRSHTITKKIDHAEKDDINKIVVYYNVHVQSEKHWYLADYWLLFVSFTLLQRKITTCIIRWIKLNSYDTHFDTKYAATVLWQRFLY